MNQPPHNRQNPYDPYGQQPQHYDAPPPQPPARKRGRGPLFWFLVVAGALAAAIGISSVAGSGGGTGPGNPDVYQRIAAETDCAALQAEFDTAATGHKRDMGSALIDDGDTGYMEAAEARMKNQGCH